MDTNSLVHEARVALGEQLAAMRLAAGYSQEALARRIDGYGRSTVGNVERGRQNVAAAFWQRADLVLGAGGSLVRAHHRLQEVVQAARDEQARSAEDRYMAVVGTAGALPDLPAGTGPAVRPSGVASAQAMSQAFRAADRKVGGRYLYPSVIRYLRADIGPGIVAAAPRQARQMLSAAASFECMAGWMARDTGRDDLAKAHFNHAVRLARAADDAPLMADILAAMSHLALRAGDPREACRLAVAGLDRAEVKPLKGLGARLTALEARSRAKLGDAGGARKRLGVAGELMAAARDEPGWLGHYDGGSWAADAAACLRDLGDLRGAKRHAEAAVELRTSERARSRSLALISLATLHVLDRTLDAACSAAQRALAASRSVSSAQVAADLGELYMLLQPHRRTKDVREVVEQLRFVPGLPT